MARPTLLVILALGVAGCRTSQHAAKDPVQVAVLQLSFPEAERGEIELSLDLENSEPRAGAVSAVWWELWLGGRFFAAGTQGVQQVLPLGGHARLELALPVVFRHAAQDPQTTAFDVGVRGRVAVHFGGELVFLPFHAARRLVLEGAPVLAVEEE
ncbi:MAG: hypothetical protein ACOZIN_19365 [Myxococcota bacterium]